MNWPAHYNHVFACLKGLRRNETSWTAFCPAHEDNRPGGNPSLSIGIGDRGQLMLTCHSPSHCTAKSIVDAMGLKFDDLFPDNARSRGMEAPAYEGEKKEFVCAYDYVDEVGKLLFQVCRFKTPSGKTFVQRIPNPDFDRSRMPGKDNREWVYSVGECRRVLYRLPKLLESMKRYPDATIFIHEGEKAVDFAWQFNLISTCCSGGAGKWLPECSEVLRGRSVVVLVDDDPPHGPMGRVAGQDHARDVCHSLFGVAADLKQIRFTHNHDRSDFFDWATSLGGVQEKKKVQDELRSLMYKQPYWIPSWVDLPPAMKKLVPMFFEMTHQGTESISGYELIGRLRIACANLESQVASGGSVSQDAIRAAAILLLGAGDGT